MTNEAVSHAPVPFDDFARDLEGFFDRVVHRHEEVLIENEHGEIALLKPAPLKKRPRKRRTITDEDHQAFLSSAGSWGDVDVDAFIKYIHESRQISTRPEIEL
ncbi:MAG TPA: hypothetical protein VJ183_20620 [Chloroflexia bacterium]|nr:hypothetical protein [Chloroflexia bacterium]